VCRRSAAPASDTYEFFLKIGIVLLGVRFLLGDIVKLGGVSLVCVVLELALAIVVMTALGRWFKAVAEVDEPAGHRRLRLRACRRSSPPKGAIEADDEDASYAIAGDSGARRGQPGSVSARRARRWG
jgi:hypothetical protein